jgi:hypothetical protein
MYTVKSVKIFRGMEGQGYNATLCRDGRPVALVIESATGGELDIEWRDYKEPKLRRVVRRYGKPVEIPLTPEENRLYDHLDGKTYPGLDGRPELMPPDIFIEDLVSDFLETRSRVKACRTATLYRLVGDAPEVYWKISLPYSSGVAKGLREKYGDRLAEILNETHSKEQT